MSKNEIIYLDDYEYVRLRPEIYCGSVLPFENDIFLIQDSKLVFKSNYTYSIGLYKLFDEILDNAIDEIKRCLKKDKNFIGKIKIFFETESNKITIIDNGRGFPQPEKINDKTKISNLETAITKLKASSNFYQTEYSDLIGMNGVGASVVFILSEYFKVLTKTKTIQYEQIWNDLKTIKKSIIKNNSKSTGTLIEFIPHKVLFQSQRFQDDILLTKLILKKFALEHQFSNNIELEFSIDNKKQNLDFDFLPQYLKFETQNLICYLIPKSSSNLISFSFVNNNLCFGKFQKQLEEVINTHIFQNEKANSFYTTIFILALDQKNLKFSDQNKTNLNLTKNIVDSLKANLINFIKTNLQSLNKNEIVKKINQEIQNYEQNLLNKQFKKLHSRTKNKKILTDKFFSSEKKIDFFITEGLSACGSLNQIRDPKTQSTYALRGKIKNVQKLADLLKNEEISNLISLLGLEIEDKGKNCPYKRIFIVTDADIDGIHITTLLLNFFTNWFPEVIDQKKLFLLKIPLFEYKNKYYFDINDLQKLVSKSKNIRYLKGLGSLNLNDWDYIFKNLQNFSVQITKDEMAYTYLRLAFSDDTNLRKEFLK